MKILYIANVRLPTEKAHGVQIMQMCAAFSALGNEVELVAPMRFNQIKEDPFEYYDIERKFKITKLPCLDLVKLGRIGFWVQYFSFAKMAALYSLFRKADIIYSRDILPLFLLSFFKKNIFWEAHRGEFNFIIKRILKKCNGIISITSGLKEFYILKGADENKILVAPDAVDIREFDVKISKEEARNRLSLPKGKILLGYVGMLKTMGMEKGIDIAIEAMKLLPEATNFVLVGGRREDIEFYKKMAKESGLAERVLFIGQVKHQIVPMYLKSFDILIAPFPENEHYKFYMSPLKIFEYMAAGWPIVASDLPSIREILNEKNAILIKPDDPESLAEGIKKVLQNKDFYDKISRQAQEDVQDYTWEKRAEKILNFLIVPKNNFNENSFNTATVNS